MRNLDYCSCTCHHTPGMKHIRACCINCPYCGRNITPSAERKHIAEHIMQGEASDRRQRFNPNVTNIGGKIFMNGHLVCDTDRRKKEDV